MTLEEMMNEEQKLRQKALDFEKKADALKKKIMDKIAPYVKEKVTIIEKHIYDTVPVPYPVTPSPYDRPYVWCSTNGLEITDGTGFMKIMN